MNNLLHRSKLFMNRNASTILTCMGGIGTVATAVMAVRVTPKALDLLEKAEEKKGEALTKIEKVKVAAPVYVPSVLVGVSTLACIFGANVMGKRQQASMISAYALLENSYKEHKKKVEELYGTEGADRVRDEIAKDKYQESEITVAPDKHLFYDEFSGRYFESTTENVLRAEYELNRLLSKEFGVFLNEFYEMLDIPPTDYGDFLGWSTYELSETYWYSWVEFKHTKVVLDDGLECTIITMGMEPTYDFENY